MRSWIDVATLAKTKNSKGRFTARAAVGLPFLLEIGDEVVLVPPQLDVPRTAKVADVRPVDEVSAEVSFEGVADPETSRLMVGMHCLIRRELLDEEVFESSPGAWEGWHLVDVRLGAIGEVRGVIQNPAQSLLEVERPDGGQVLVPVVDQIVLDVDVSSSTVTVDLPNGLLDL